MSAIERQIEAISIAVTKALHKLGLAAIKSHPFFGMNEKESKAEDKKAA